MVAYDVDGTSGLVERLRSTRPPDARDAFRRAALAYMADLERDLEASDSKVARLVDALAAAQREAGAVARDLALLHTLVAPQAAAAPRPPAAARAPAPGAPRGSATGYRAAVYELMRDGQPRTTDQVREALTPQFGHEKARKVCNHAIHGMPFLHRPRPGVWQLKREPPAPADAPAGEGHADG